MQIDRRSATFAALIFSTVDVMYRAKKAKELFPCSKEFLCFLSQVQQIEHAIFTQLQYKKYVLSKLHFSDQNISCCNKISI